MVAASDNLLEYLSELGFIDIIIPFILVFTIIYAIMQKIHPFQKGTTEEDKSTSKKINAVIAGILGLATILPHLMGVRPNPVTIMYEALPSVSIWIIAIVCLFILMGVFGGKFKFSGSFSGYIAIIAILIVGYIFLSAADIIEGLPDIPFLHDPAIQAIFIIILVFGIVIHYITKEDKDKDDEKGLGKFLKGMKTHFED